MRSLFFAATMALLSANVLSQTTAPSDRIAALQAKLPAWKSSLDHLRAQGQDISYPKVTYTILENFLPYATADLNTLVPDNWGFTPVNGSQSSMQVSHDHPHSGQSALSILNSSPQSPNRYGMLECAQTLSLTPGVPYTFSVWVRTSSPGKATLVAGHSWQFRTSIPDTQNEWRLISLTFTPTKKDAAFKPRIVTESETSGISFDDFYVCQSANPETGKNLAANPDLEQSWTQRRALNAISDMESMSTRLDAELSAALQGGKLPTVPRWTGTQRPRIDGPSFLAPTNTGTRPVFFIGYGHFDQARRDIPLFPSLGNNIIQQEAGPHFIFPKPDVTDLSLVDNLHHTLQTAAANGVAVDLLLSPHYFPDWMFHKFPQMRKQRADFFPFSVYHPAVRPFLQRYIAELLAPIKDDPALFSICLSNEPINVEEPGDFAVLAWHQWLTSYHHDLATLNAHWHATYKTFDEIPYPDPRQDHTRATPAWADWVRFNQEYFADFHKMLADAVHAVAPNLPVHAKATTWNDWRAEDIRSGDDATFFATFSDIMGNDSVNLWNFGKDAPSDGPVERGTTKFAQGWLENALSYDLLRSVKNVPVFNSENHFIFDREPRWLSADHIRAGLWQGALHGQSATTMWVWGRTTDAQSDEAGSMMERPACVEAAGRVCLDLNRVANEMTTLQNKPADVQILQSTASATWDGATGQNTLIATYTALSFTGLKIGFITEHQLEAGILPSTSIVLCPAVTHLSAAAAKTLSTYKGRLLFIATAPIRDEYDNPLIAPLAGKLIPFTSKWLSLYQSLQPELPISPVQVLSENNHASTDIQWLTQDHILNLYNPRPWPVKIHIAAPATGTNLLTGQHQDLSSSFDLLPLDVRIYRIDSTPEPDLNK
ncbi:MAG TPA: beta-galactosidase [Tepidisphaeraceae bacterium]|jgi:hypothetical protein|nr:beta-galactosidase [Tepidisphaeraceae bacterium]